MSSLVSSRWSRKLILLPFLGAVLACASCSKEEPPKPTPPPQITDTKPVGAGLKVIGFAMLGAAVVGVLGRMLD
ncbi:MAG: hypothetical protein ACSHYB_08575 [Roseibacillus sp.]